MRVHEIGQQLRAYRMESGMRADEIAAQLGVSRAALYRYEKGGVIKLDTVQRLAELLKISPLSLLGIGVEYYARPIGFFERIRQVEDEADQILQLGLPLCDLVASDAYDDARADALGEAGRGLDGEAQALTQSEQLLEIQAARRASYQDRRPSIVSVMPEHAVRQLLTDGICAELPLSEKMRTRCRAVAAVEIEAIADILEAEPMGLQFGLLPGGAAPARCVLLRQRDRATLAINPLSGDAMPDSSGGVAMVTGAPDAVAAHQKVIEHYWAGALKGAAAAARLRGLLAEAVAW